MRQTINIESRWSKLFSVRSLHEYYDNGECEDLIFEPTQVSMKALKNLKLVCKPTPIGFIILCLKEKTFELLNTNGRPKKLTFIIKNKNRFFAHFSNLSFLNQNNVYYYSNRIGDKVDDEKLLQDKKSKIGANISLYNRNQQIAFSGKESDQKDIKVIDEDGKAITNIDRVLKYDDVNNLYRISLSLLEEGRYTIKVKNKVIEELYITENLDIHIWGIVDIFFDKVKKDYQLFDTEVITPQTYVLKFEQRFTYWKYILLEKVGKNKKLTKYDDAKVTYEGEELQFSKPYLTKLNNGKEVMCIESKKEMPLKEVQSSLDRLELKLKKGSKWLNRSIKLPKPSFQMVRPDKTTKNVYSTVFVYIN